MALRLLTLAAVSALAVSCGGPTCPPPEVRLPADTQTLNWAAEGYGTVRVGILEREGDLVLDTGFPQTALDPQFARGLPVTDLEVQLGAARAGGIHAGLLLLPIPEDGILGADVLHQLPLRFHARGRFTEVLPAFQPAAAWTAPVEVISAGTCRGSVEEAGPIGPWGMLVEAEVEGRWGTFLLDTGAHLTFVRTALAEPLKDRPSLEGIRILSGLSDGFFLATATRARTLSVGTAQSEGALLLSAPELDQALDALSADYTHAARREVRIDGLLGWTFLREFEVTLAHGRSAREDRAVLLNRFEGQDHYQREFVGIGAYLVPSEDPPGRRIDGFFGTSPAREAGLEVGQVIRSVDGVALSQDDPVTSEDGDVLLEVEDEAGVRTVTVPFLDLLPDP